MDIFVKTTFVIILAFASINTLFSLIVYATSRREIYLRTSLFWVSLILNFVVQGRAQGGEANIIWSYGFTVVPINLLAYASLFFSGGTYPRRAMLGTTLLAGGLTFFMLRTDWSFTWKAMPFALAVALPTLYTVYHYVWRAPGRLTSLMMVHAGVLFLMAVHSLDFAFFRMEPAAQLWGWPIAYALAQIMAVLFPTLTLDFMHTEERERLRRIIDQRTHELVTANQHLENLFVRKDYLFKMLTHDISNPLSVILTRASMPELCLANPEKFVTDVRLMTERISNLIQQVREFDTIESRLANVATDEVNVLEAVRDCESLFADRLAQKSLRFDYAPAELATLTVRVERSSFLTSVLPNLVNNAIKFSRPGSVIRVAAGPRPENMVSLAIEDAGLGIPAELVGKLFEFGQNVSRPGTAGERGTGFGLPILARLVEAYGGQILVHTRVELADQPGMTRVELILPGHAVAGARSA